LQKDGKKERVMTPFIQEELRIPRGAGERNERVMLPWLFTDSYGRVKAI
jgi:hypothetical protein